RPFWPPHWEREPRGVLHVPLAIQQSGPSGRREAWIGRFASARDRKLRYTYALQPFSKRLDPMSFVAWPRFVARRRLVLLGALGIVLLNAFGAPLTAAADERRYEFAEMHMGVEFRLVLYSPDEQAANRAAQAAFDRIA